MKIRFVGLKGSLGRAGSLQNIEFDKIPRPAQAARIVGDLAQASPPADE